MVSYNYLGYGVTDENGIAKLDHNAQGQEISHSYTGVGAGEIDVLASLDNPIAEGSIVSETYSVIDGLLFDTCTEAVTGRWYNYQTILSVSYDNNGMTVTKPTNDGSTTRYLYYNDPTISTTKISNYNTITTPMAIEFDCNQINGSIQLVFADNANTPNQRFIDITTTGHYKIVLDGSTVKVYCDNVEITNPSIPLALTGANTQFRFGFNAADESITIKNFVIYNI